MNGGGEIREVGRPFAGFARLILLSILSCSLPLYLRLNHWSLSLPIERIPLFSLGNELLSIAISFSIFSVTWYKDYQNRSKRNLILGFGFLVVGILRVARFASSYGSFRPLGYSLAIYWVQAGFLLAASLRPMTKPYQPKDRFKAIGISFLLTAGLLFGCRHPSLDHYHLLLLIPALIHLGLEFLRHDPDNFFIGAVLLAISQLTFIYLGPSNILGCWIAFLAQLFFYKVLVFDPPSTELQPLLKLYQGTDFRELRELGHETKNVLTALRAMAQFGQSLMETTPKNKDLYTRIISEIDQLSSLITFTLARQKPDLVKVNEDLIRLLKDLVDLLGAKIEMAGINISCSFPEQVPLVPIYPQLLRQALLNVIHNALQAMPQGGDLQIKLMVHPRRVAITIKDNGCGMSSQVSSRAFEPFFTTKETGTGLGLAITRQIIEEVHQGKLQMKSQVNCGTTFLMELPLSDQQNTFIRMSGESMIDKPKNPQAGSSSHQKEQGRPQAASNA